MPSFSLPPKLQAVRDSLTEEELRLLVQETLNKYAAPVYATGVKEGREQLLKEQREARERKKVSRGKKIWITVVYFIRSPTAVKIGTTNDAARRLRVLQTSHPEDLVLAATAPGGRSLEAEYHKRFSKYRLRGEWFDPHPDILAEISRLNTEQGGK